METRSLDTLRFGRSTSWPITAPMLKSKSMLRSLLPSVGTVAESCLR